MVRATSFCFLHSYAPFSLEVCKTSPTRARVGGRRLPIGARGEATRSKNQVVAYGCYVMGLKLSPPTIYYGVILGLGTEPNGNDSYLHREFIF